MKRKYGSKSNQRCQNNHDIGDIKKVRTCVSDAGTKGRHDDVIKWRHFPRFLPFVRGIHRSPVNSPHKGQWCGALMFSLICSSINGWVNNGEAGDLIRHRAHYDAIVMDKLLHPTQTAVFEILMPAFENGLQGVKQFAHSWNYPAASACSHFSPYKINQHWDWGMDE